MKPEAVHSITSLSKAYQWLPCPGSVPASLSLGPQEPTEAMREGTEAHARAEGVLRAYLADRSRLPTLTLDDDLDGFVDHVVTLRELHSAKKVLLEQRVTLDASLDLFGTLDVAMRTSPKSAVIIDLKWGKGYAVQAENNPQLAGYAAALDAMYGPFDTIEAQIYQPRAYDPVRPVRAWTIKRPQLTSWKAKLRAGAKEVHRQINGGRSTWTFQTGDHCMSCAYVGKCPTVAGLTAEARGELLPAVVDQAAAVFPGAEIAAVNMPDVASLTPEQVSRILKVLPLAEKFGAEVRKRALIDGLAGSPPPGWKVVQSTGRRKWADPNLAAAALEVAGIEPWDKSLRALTTVEAELKKAKRGQKGVAAAVMAKLTVRTPGGPTLVPEGDMRLPYVTGGGVSAADFPDDLDDGE